MTQNATRQADRGPKADAAPAPGPASTRQPPEPQGLGRALGNRDIGRLLGAAAGAGGGRLPSGVASRFGQALGHDFRDVRVHTGPAAARAADALNANALTLGRDVVFGAGRYDPSSRPGQRLLAHELTHVAQFDRGSGPATPREGLEAEAGRAAAGAVVGRPAGPIVGRATAALGPLLDDKPKKKDDDDTPTNPFADWKTEPDSFLIIHGDDQLFFVPAADAIFFATEKTQAAFESSSSHVTQDLGTLFEVPATGASGTRIFQAGVRSAIVLDAGYDPTPGQTRQVAAVYVNQVMGIAARLGIRKISRIQPIHGHSDHVSGIPAIVTQLNVAPDHVVIPTEFEALRAVRTVLTALRDPANTALVARGFGPGWNPQRPPKDKGGPGDVYRGSFMVGELVVEMVGLRSALKTAGANPDLASYLTKVTRRTDNAKVVVLGDFRGVDLATIRTTMEAQNPGSWNEFFRGVTTISGFSHHVGKMVAGDVAGIMGLLDATLLQGGTLRVVEQTNLGVSTQARTDTLEFAARLGIPVTFTGMPTPGSAPSAAGATRDTTYTQGTDATAQPVIASGLTTGVQRLRRLAQARLTIEQWRPWLEELNTKEKIDAVSAQFDTSMEQLRRSLRTAMEAAANVRAEARPAGTTGPRDYSSTGGATGTAYETAVTAIPSEVPAEKTLTAEAERGLEELRNKNIEEVPLKVALHRAITQGEYSNQAFTYMMGQLNPMTRDELIGRKPGATGALVPRNVAFQRVRAQFNFERSVLPGETVSLSGFSGGRLAGARAVGGVMLALELWNDIGEPLWKSHQYSQQINITKNLAPFLRRLAFWQQMGVRTKYFGIHDPTFGSPDRYDDPAVIVQKLKADDLDAIVIEKPGLTDADVLALAAWLAQNVRNYDEYASLFEDSFQDAVKYDAKGGTWENAEWLVRVGWYETSGSNHVEEEWYKHDKLTELMRHYIPWLIANTRTLLQQAGKGGPDPPMFSAMLGDLSPGGGGGPALKRVRLKRPEDEAFLRVPFTGNDSSNWGSTPTMSYLMKHKFANPPVFYALADLGFSRPDPKGETRVMGADFNTYAAVRDLETKRRSVGTYGSELNHEFMSRDRNSLGYVWIDAAFLEDVPDAPAAPAVVPPQPAQQPAPPAALQPVKPLPSVTGGKFDPSQTVLPVPWTDVLGRGKPLPIGPRVFGSTPNDRIDTDKGRSILPGIGGSF